MGWDVMQDVVNGLLVIKKKLRTLNFSYNIGNV